MRIISFILLLMVLTVISCDESYVEKPQKLIPEKQMIEILVDVHIAEATFNNRRYEDDNVKNSTSVNFYYSALAKHNVADTVFEKSFVYYAAKPKEFEKMYRDVMNILSEMEQEYSGRKNELLDFGDQE